MFANVRFVTVNLIRYYDALAAGPIECGEGKPNAGAKDAGTFYRFLNDRAHTHMQDKAMGQQPDAMERANSLVFIG